MIGVYVHHHGRGHLHRVLPVIRTLLEAGEDITVLIAGSLDHSLLPPGTQVEHLPTAGPHVGREDDMTFAARRAAIAWIDQVRPRAVWVDSSPAMSVAVRMTGTPMVSTVAPGSREDEPHQLRCQAADGLIAAWPPGVHETTLARTAAPVTEVGGLSRFASREHVPQARRRPLVAHLNSSGTGGDHRFWGAVRATVGELDVAEWLELGGPDGVWFDDPWPALCTADVVVTSGGESCVADAACADVPLVVVPDYRPHGEQDATAAALDAIPGVTVLSYGHGPSVIARAVLAQLERARDDDAAGIRALWGVDGAASRAAEVIRSVAASANPESTSTSTTTTTTAATPRTRSTPTATTTTKLRTS